MPNFTYQNITKTLICSLFVQKISKIGLTLLGVLLFCLLSTNAHSQSPGLIFKPSTDLGGVRPLDPDRDGYASTLGGPFLTNDETESEIPFRKIPAKDEPNSDVATGPSCGFTDFVQNTNKYSAATAFQNIGGVDYLYFRFRLGGFSPASKGYSILIDTDQLFGTADPNYNTYNPGFEIEVQYVTNFGVRVYNVDGLTSGNGTLITTYPESQHAQKVIALTTDCGNLDVFYDFFIPFSILEAAPFGLTTATPLRMVANTVQSTQGALQGPISDIGGTEKSGIAGFTEMIDLQPGTSVSGIAGGAIVVRSDTPTINGPIESSANAITGTSTEPEGSTIRVTINGTTYTTTVLAGGNWTLDLTAIPLTLTAGWTVSATAENTTDSELESFQTSSLTVITACTVLTDLTGFTNCAGKAYEATGTFPTGTTVNFYYSNATANPLLIADNDPTGGYVYNCQNPIVTSVCNAGTGNCLPNGTFFIEQTNADGCKSNIISDCRGNSTSTSTVAITGYQLGNPGLVSGTGTANSWVYLFVGSTTAEGRYVGTVQISASGTWSISTKVLASDQFRARTTNAATSCWSLTAGTLTVPASSPNPPVVNGPIYNGNTTVSGTSDAAVGSTITVYKNGVSIGTTTVLANGTWELTGISPALATGEDITATVTVSGAMSGVSNTIVVSGNQSTKIADVALIGAVNYQEGGTTVQVDFPSLAAGEIVKLYVDGVEIASYTATGGETTFDFTAALDGNDQFDAFALYTDGVLSATVTEVGRSPSPIGATQIVDCVNPDLATEELEVSAVDACDNSTVTINMLNSDAGIIYELLDGATQIAPSRIGTGGTAPSSTITFLTFNLGTSDYLDLKIRAIRFSGSEPFCNTIKDQPTTITTYAPPADAPLTPTIVSPGTIASGTAATVIINPTEGADVTYTLYNKADDSQVSASTAGNGGSLSITTNVTFTSNVDIYVIARKTHTTPDPDLVCDLTLTTEARFEVKLPPTAKPDINNTLPGMAVTGSVLANDTDPDGGTLSVNTTPTVAPANGTLVLNIDGTYTYQPNAGFVGEDTFTYEVCSSTSGFCSTAVVVINVYDTSDNTASANNAPVVHNDVAETVTDVTVTGNVLSNDFDPDAGQTLSVTPATSVAITGGTYSIDANGNYTFVPTTGFTGTTSFTYTVCDDGSPQACETATVNITVSAPAPAAANNAPFAQDDAIQAEAGVAYTATLANGLLINDFDPEGGALTVNTTPVTAPSHGAVTLNADGTYTYTPAAGYYGPDSFTYQVCDPGPLCDVATVYVMVQPRSPSSQPDINNTLMNTPVAGNVLTNDQDPQGLALTVNTTPVSGPSNGSIVLNADGTYTYTPNFGFQGEDVVTYQTCNSAGVCQNNTLTIKVQQQLFDPITMSAVNNPPVANNDVGQTIAGVTLAGNVTGNDFDRDLQIITVSEVNGVSGNVGAPVAITGGSVTLGSDGTYSFVPNAGFVGTTSFTYTITDNDGSPLSSTATVNITVYPDHDALNNAPFAQDDAGFVFQNTTAAPTSLPGNVLVNDFDPKGTNPMTGTVSLVSGAGVSNGSLVLNTDGSYTYIPTLGYTGPDQFTYQVCDAGTPALCDVATVYLTVQAAAPLPPVARNDIANTLKDSPVIGPILENDADVYGLRLTANPTLVPALPLSGPNNGAVVFNADGTYTYTPTAGYVGPDSFVYEVCNSAGLCNQAVVTLNVVDPATTVNVAPVVQNDAAETIEDSPVSGNVLANDFDYNTGDTFTVTQINGATFTSGGTINLTNGDLVMNSDGTYTYTPDPGYAGLETFTYQTCDNGSPVECATATVSITVYPTGTPSVPFAQNDAYVTAVDAPITRSVFGNDSNLGTVTSVNVITPPSNGGLTGPDNTGAFTYTPDASYSGPDYFVYEICNANGCSSATVSMLTFAAGGSLPLDLLSFQAEKVGEQVKLTWVTINEIEVSHFEIERSADGQNFSKIGAVDARNAGIEVSNYVFVDAAALAGSNYYRFKQVEQDGSSVFSPMAFVSFVQDLVLDVYPNPATDFITIKLSTAQAEAQVSLMDAKGQQLQNTQAKTDAEGKLKMNVSSLKAGTYYLQINVNGQTLNRMLVKY